MARVRNTMRLIKSSIGNIDPRYDMGTENIMDILEHGSNEFDLIVNGFRFGYMQGTKAAKAKTK